MKARVMILALAILAGVGGAAGYSVWQVASRVHTDNQATACKASTERLRRALGAYAAEHGDRLPPAERWSDAILPYVEGGRASFICPAVPKQACSYAMNRAAGGAKLSSLAHAGSFVVLFESDAGWNAAGGPELMLSVPRHFGGGYAVFGNLGGRWCAQDYRMARLGKTWLKQFADSRYCWTSAPARW